LVLAVIAVHLFFQKFKYSMFYIHQSNCISHQQTLGQIDWDELKLSKDNQLHAIEPKYHGIAPGHLRRMGKAARMGVGAGLPLLLENKVDGILIGTSNGGQEDSMKFLDQIMEYDEGRLTPTNFVQSTYNAIAGQLAMITENKGYNITHVHRGLAFEAAALDAAMLLMENPEKTYLIGGVDEISVRNYRTESLAGWYKEENVLNRDLFDSSSIGTLPGEGAAMFLVNNKRHGAASEVVALKLLNTDDENVIVAQLELFLQQNLPAGQSIDLLLSGESGDNRFTHFYTACEPLMNEQATIARFKHVTGEFQTASALGLWLASQILQQQVLPAYMIKRKGELSEFKHVLFYNNFKGTQHSFTLLQKV
jgi:Beta-ketoacyl synthase, N-terminal domain